MKALLIPVLVLSLFSCANKRGEIVERQKFLKKKIDSLSLQMDRGFSMDTLETISMQRVIATEEYDSLEIELKKY